MAKAVDSLERKIKLISSSRRAVLDVDDSIGQLQKLLAMVGENDRRLLQEYISRLETLNHKAIDDGTERRLTDVLVALGSEVLMAQATAGLSQTVYNEMLEALRDRTFMRALVNFVDDHAAADHDTMKTAEHLQLARLEDGSWMPTKRGEAVVRAYHLLAQRKS